MLAITRVSFLKRNLYRTNFSLWAKLSILQIYQIHVVSGLLVSDGLISFLESFSTKGILKDLWVCPSAILWINGQLTLLKVRLASSLS